MSLRDQLRSILPQILPASPSDAIKGTELIRLVRFRLGDEYSDATLRYHFSILSYDPASPIAKVDQGQGYYLRIDKEGANGERQGMLGDADVAADSPRGLFSRFHAVIERHSVHNSSFPFPLHPTSADEWELPDLVITDWEFEAGQDDAPRLDETLINLKRHLGASVVTLSAVQLKLGITRDTCRADFFKTVSAARWANQGQLYIASTVSDEVLVNTLRLLGHEFGIGITSFGLDSVLLAELPAPDEIRRMSEGEFESLENMLKIQPISVAAHRPSLDWQHLSALRKKHESIATMMEWLNECIDTRKPSTAR